MKSKYYQLKTRAIQLRKSGNTYGDVKKKLNAPVPKSTLSEWFKNISLSEKQQKKIDNNINKNIQRAREKALASIKIKRGQYLKSVRKRVEHLKNIADDKDIAKIMLAMLYLGEGSKMRKASLVFGNSDPIIIALFLCLLRRCYDIDEDKFRCTLQCRADQNIKVLENFWSKITDVPLKQFYKARVDPRTIGKKSKKIDYKGVCRIDYFSADTYNEILKIIEVITTGL